MISVIEAPLSGRGRYPYTAEEIRERLARLPEGDLEGLAQVRLTPATRYDEGIYGRYYFDSRPLIQLYSQPPDLTFRTSFGRRHARCCLADGIRFGLRWEARGETLRCTWDEAALRTFMLEFVLLHEVGHHVAHLRRQAKGTPACAGFRDCERFADAYACEHSRHGLSGS